MYKLSNSSSQLSSKRVHVLTTLVYFVAPSSPLHALFSVYVIFSFIDPKLTLLVGMSRVCMIFPGTQFRGGEEQLANISFHESLNI